MKSVIFIAFAGLLLTSCEKQEPKAEQKPQAAAAPKQEARPEKKMPPVPQGELPKMDPKKAKLIAVPSTPEDPELKKAEKPQDEVKKAGTPGEGEKK